MSSSIIKTQCFPLMAVILSLHIATHKSHLQCAFCFSAGINKGSCFRINHFPEDNDYDTDSSEYILRKSLQPLHLQTLQPLIRSSFFLGSFVSGDGVITRVLNVSWHLYPSPTKARCHDSNWSYGDDEVCCVLMSNRACLKQDFTHITAHLTFDQGSLMKASVKYAILKPTLKIV